MDADRVLLQRYLRRRDEQAFALIVQRYGAMVYTTSRRVLGDDARAQEVAQETFLQLLRKAESISQSLAGWLHRTAARLAIDVLRSDQARQQREQNRARLPLTDTTWSELSPYVDEALLSLPEESRLLLVEHFLEGRSQADMASARRVSRPTMHRRLKEALSQLRGQLSRMGVTAAVTAVVALLQQQAVATPPATLMSELGKLALVSGRSPSLADCATEAIPWRSTLLAVTIGTTAAIIIVLIFALLFMNHGVSYTDHHDHPSSLPLQVNP